MNKILTLFALSAISAAVMAEGTIQTQPQQIMPYAPFAPVYSLTPEQQQAMFEQRNKAAQEAFEARRQLFEQVAAEQTRIAQELTKSRQQAMDEQRKQNADMAHSFPGAMPPFAAPEFAGMPFEMPEPPMMPSPFGNDSFAMPDFPKFPDLAGLSKEERRAKMKSFVEEHRQAMQKHREEVRKQMQIERATAMRDVHPFL